MEDVDKTQQRLTMVRKELWYAFHKTAHFFPSDKRPDVLVLMIFTSRKVLEQLIRNIYSAYQNGHRVVR